MNIILLSGSANKTGSIRLRLPWLMATFLLLSLGMASGLIWAGYTWGLRVGAPNQEATSRALETMHEQQQQALQAAQDRTREHLDALALRLGQLQTHVLRLNALGERLTELGQLEGEEFNFADEPPRGGLDAADAQSLSSLDLESEMDSLAWTLEDRERKLKELEELIMDRKLQQEVQPAGRPVQKGWISSHYGYRKDPFTGRKVFHQGVDVAGKKDSDVIAVAAGVVTWAGARYGYGRMVEINHGNGYVTRYGHNGEVLVQVGDTVAKGQTIALLGSTGRSTGPHVHFEVLQDGKPVNPASYLRAAQ